MTIVNYQKVRIVSPRARDVVLKDLTAVHQLQFLLDIYLDFELYIHISTLRPP